MIHCHKCGKLLATGADPANPGYTFEPMVAQPINGKSLPFCIGDYRTYDVKAEWPDIATAKTRDESRYQKATPEPKSVARARLKAAGVKDETLDALGVKA